VNDILTAAKSMIQINRLKTQLGNEFVKKDLGDAWGKKKIRDGDSPE
jgi:hypothetical protein